jgi:hypothetical protein
MEGDGYRELEGSPVCSAVDPSGTLFFGTVVLGLVE